MGFYQLQRKQYVPATIDEVWNFISTPANLKKITPGYMGFEITSDHLSEKMYAGMIISYKVKPLPGIPVTWVTEITHVVEKQFFIDEQRIGPYAFWHHQHFVETQGDGVLMTDIVSYKPPFGVLGNIANFLLIKGKLQEIFEFRKTALEKIFPGS